MVWGLLLALCGGLVAPVAAAGRHRLAVIVTTVTDEKGTYNYTMIGQLDDVTVAYYRNDTREVRPTQEWVAQAVGTEYLQKKSWEFWSYHMDSKGVMRWWMKMHNQTGGVHTRQIHVSCSLSGQTPVDPRFQYAYDGRDFISFDNQTGTWVAAMHPAFLVKQIWETTEISWTRYVRRLLQQELLDTLQSLLQRGRGVLQKQVPPVVSVSRSDAAADSVTLSCYAWAFHPRPIHVSWVRDGEDVLAETDSSGILPNADGTYYTQSSLEISPQQEERHRYACRVEHSSLGEPTVAWVPRKKGLLIPGVLAAIALALAGGAVGVSAFLWRRKSTGRAEPSYAPAATKSEEDPASSSPSGAGTRSP